MGYAVEVTLANDEKASFNVFDTTIDPGDTPTSYTTAEYLAIMRFVTVAVEWMTRANLKGVKIDLTV